MLGPDVVMTQSAGFFDRQLKHFFSSRRQFDSSARMSPDACQALDHLLYAARFKPELTQHPAGDSTLLTDQAQEKMLRADVIVV